MVGLESMDESGTLLWGAPLNHPSPSPLTSCASNLAKVRGGIEAARIVSLERGQWLLEFRE
jgi:hypothetical protein